MYLWGWADRRGHRPSLMDDRHDDVEPASLFQQMFYFRHMTLAAL